MDLIDLLQQAKENLWKGEGEIFQTEKTPYVCWAISRTVAMLDGQKANNFGFDREELVPQALYNMIGEHIQGHGNTVLTFVFDKLGKEEASKLSSEEMQTYRFRLIDSMISQLQGGKKDEFFSHINA